MNRTMKSITAAGLAVAICAAALPSTADAGWYKHNNDAAIAAGIIGFTAGAILGSVASKNRYYYAPRTHYYGPPRPWTPAWYSYCRSKYRSFNPKTGYFFGYDGRYHFCR